MGHGRIDVAGDILPAGDALARIGLEPLELGPKEGLALINGTQASTAIALDALFFGERVFWAAVHAGALSVDALKGSIKPFDPRLSEVRGQPGQIRVAAAIREPARRLADRRLAPSLRAGPGPLQLPLPAAGDGRRARPNDQCRAHVGDRGRGGDRQPDRVRARREWLDSAISGGNFHAQPVAFAADIITMALCEVGSLSERRTSVLVDPKMSGLPAFLTDDGGVNSGLMIPQVTAAALVSENKSLAFPASVDSIPTSAGQEDHVSMAPIAARKAVQVARNAAGIVAVELIAAAQGVDYHAPLETSPPLQALHGRVRAISPHLETDRYWADQMAALQAAVLAGRDRRDRLAVPSWRGSRSATCRCNLPAMQPRTDRRPGIDDPKFCPRAVIDVGDEQAALPLAVAGGGEAAHQLGSDELGGAALGGVGRSLGGCPHHRPAPRLAAGGDGDCDAASGLVHAFRRGIGGERGQAATGRGSMAGTWPS